MMNAVGLVRLSELTDALDTAIRSVEKFESTETVFVRSIALLDPSDLSQPIRHLPRADLYLLIGASEHLLRSWLAQFAEIAASARPVALVLKADLDTAFVREAARNANISVIYVDSRARWDTLHSLLQARMDREQSRTPREAPEHATASVSDLQDLATLIAAGTHGLVTIEAPDSRVLTYSASDGTADALRVQAVLGRAAPSDAMRRLAEWGVIDAIERSRRVVTVPEHPELGMKRRLVSGIHSANGQYLGSIWVQEGLRPFTEDAKTIVRGAAVSAAAILMRTVEAPSTEEMMLQRLFGAHGGVDPATAADYLRIPDVRAAAVIGLSPSNLERTAEPAAEERKRAGTQVARLLKLHAKAYSPKAAVAVIDSRAYVLLPEVSDPVVVHQWVEQLVQRFDALPELKGHPLRAAIATPVEGLANVSAARSEVDRVLDSTGTDVGRVTSLAKSRTSVFLGEVVDLLRNHGGFEDPRVEALREYDERHSAGLLISISSYLNANLNIRDAAEKLAIHPNTLRYRLKRTQAITGLDLNDSDDRLLFALQLALNPPI